ncbi:MAG: DUF3846 domain-containing protein [Muribaculaceae bacterium]|nr:DUF3846 domain-containing protein [Muribaculaceae bacterium]
MARIITTEGGATQIAPANGKFFSLEELRKAIGGGYIEIVRLNEYASLVIDEDGKRKDLDVNYYATTIAKKNKAISPHDYIVGNAVFVLNEELD